MKLHEIIKEDDSRDYKNPLRVDTSPNEIWDLSEDIIGELAKLYKEENNISTNNPDGSVNTDALSKMYKMVNEQYGTIENVPINKITTTESHLIKSHLESLVNGGDVDSSNNPPILYKSGNTYLAGDGNHRIVAAYLQKKKTVKSLVLDLDKLAKQLNIK